MMSITSLPDGILYIIVRYNAATAFPALSLHLALSIDEPIPSCTACALLRDLKAQPEVQKPSNEVREIDSHSFLDFLSNVNES
jgi:hypothetical protein